MIKTKKQMFIIIGVFTLVMMLGTVTFAFFNYTRTGVANTIRTGNINFNTVQGPAINLNNAFPIDTEETGIMNDATKVGTVTINVTGDTSYGEGIEYLVKAVNVENTINNKSVPISIDVSYVANGQGNAIGTEDEEYFDKRGGSTSYYRVLANDTISSNDDLVVGYIAPSNNGTGIDGNIVIKAYLDKNKIAITDTYPEGVVRTAKASLSEGDITACENALTEVQDASTICATSSSLQTALDTENTLTAGQISALVSLGLVTEYTDGTTSSWVNGRTVFTTSEWNSLNGISFQVKVEANEGTWVEENLSVNALNTSYFYDSDGFFGSNTNRNEISKNIKEVYFNKMGATRMQNAYDAATIKADLTYNNEGKVLAWLEENPDDNTKYNLIIASDGETYISTSPSMFQGFISMEKIEFNNINTSRLTFMTQMFANCTSLESIDLSMFDVSNITGYGGLDSLFAECTSLKEVNLSGWVINSYTTDSWFYGCTNLERIYVSSSMNFDGVLFGRHMFNGCTSLVGGNGTTYDENNPTDKTYAIIDGTNNQPGYFTDISQKPTN